MNNSHAQVMTSQKTEPVPSQDIHLFDCFLFIVKNSSYLRGPVVSNPFSLNGVSRKYLQINLYIQPNE